MFKPQPDFNNILKVIKRQQTDRPVLFEFYIDNKVSEAVSGMKAQSKWDCSWNYEMVIDVYAKCGYDYFTMHGCDFKFPTKADTSHTTRSMNQGFVITDRESFERYNFPDPKKADYSRLIKCEKYMPKGMKVIPFGPGGVLENVIELVGYENMCFMLYEDSDLLSRIFDEVGGRMVDYYAECLKYDCVGAIMANDDWGFNTSTMMSTDDMRKYVFPYHKKIVELAHKSGRCAILHSCGNLKDIMDDIIDDMKYDAKHSYEDKIIRVEDAYSLYGKRIAVLGGIDMDFVCRSKPEQIKERCLNMLKLTNNMAYALGTGNSIPNYVPLENFYAMINCIRDNIK